MLCLVCIRAIVRRSERLHNRLGIAQQPCFQARADLHPRESELFERIARWQILDMLAQALKSFTKAAARFNTSLVGIVSFAVHGKYNLPVATAL